MKLVIYLFLIFSFYSLQSQIIYSEDFTTPNGTKSTSNWSTNCSACVLETGDYFETRSNQLSARDVDGIAVFETRWILFQGMVTIQGTVLKTGDMEGPGTTFSLDHDFVDVEYRVNNTWYDIKDYLNHGISDSTFYGEDGGIYDNGVDNEWNNVLSQVFTQSGIQGDSIKIKISLRNSANAEIWGLDNITVYQEALLPVEFLFFDGVNNGFNILKWGTATELNNKGFEIQKSKNPYAFETFAFVEGVNTFQPSFYEFIDKNIGSFYYRLKQIDFNGDVDYSNTIYIENTEKQYLYINSLGQQVRVSEFSIKIPH